MKKKPNQKCPNCGAPITTEICPYCHNLTGIETSAANMEYPLIECKEANISFFGVFFPMLFAISFGLFGFGFPIVVILQEPEKSLIVILSCSLFIIISIVAFVIGIKPIIRYTLLKLKGKEIDATVYGYMNDNLTINGSPAQIVKLLVTTADGPRFILYQLGDIKRPYKLNGKIKLLVHKDMFLIKKDNKYHF